MVSQTHGADQLDTYMENNSPRSSSLALHKPQVQMDQRTQQRPDTLNLIKDEVENTLELISTCKNFLNRTVTVQALTLIINNK